MTKKEKIKKAFTAIFAIVCIAVICYGVYVVVGNLNLHSKNKKETTTTTTAIRDEEVDKMNLLAELDADVAISLHTDGKNVILTYDGQNNAFDWSGVLTKEHVSLAYEDYNGDGKKEIAVLIDQSETENATNQLHILSVKTIDKTYTYFETTLNPNSAKWNMELDFQAQQLENKKRVAFTINDNRYYFKAPMNASGQYYTFELMELGDARYQLEGASIAALVNLTAGFVDYNETVIPGQISAAVRFSSEAQQYIYTDLAFVGSPQYSIAPPVGDVASWSVRAYNNDAKVSTGLKLSDLSFTLDLNAVENRDFDTGTTQEKYLSFIVVTESYVQVAVEKSMTFDSFWLENGGCTVWLGGQDGYYAQKETKLTADDKYNYMTTYFDEKMSRDAAFTVVYKFGETLQEVS